MKSLKESIITSVEKEVKNTTNENILNTEFNTEIYLVNKFLEHIDSIIKLSQYSNDYGTRQYRLIYDVNCYNNITNIKKLIQDLYKSNNDFSRMHEKTRVYNSHGDVDFISTENIGISCRKLKFRIFINFAHRTKNTSLLIIGKKDVIEYIKNYISKNINKNSNSR